MYDLLLLPGAEGLKSVLKIFKKQSDEIRNVLPAVFYEKVVLKNSRKIPRKSFMTAHMNAHNYAEYVFHLVISQNY